MSSKHIALAAVLTFAMAAPAGIIVNASAASKKLTYEQAWAHCKSLLDQERQPGDMSSGQHRSFRGRACMEKYGYKI